MDLRIARMEVFAITRGMRKISPLTHVTGYTLEKPIKQVVMSGAYTVPTRPVDPYDILTLTKSTAG